MNRSRSFSLKKTLGLIVLPVVLIALTYFVYPSIRNNIHTVIPGEVYRSAQLPHEKLDELIQKDHIKTIFNLRGSHVGELWYTLEFNSAKQNNIRFYNWSLPAHSMPTKEQLQHIITALDEAPRPILIHCKNGADRSGLVSAFALILYKNSNFTEADKQITYRYLALSPSSVGRLVMPKYEAWLKKNNLVSNANNLKTWIASPHPLD